MRETTDQELVRCKAFLDAMGVKHVNVIYLTDDGNSCIMNPKTVAKKLGKKTERLD